MKRVSLLGQLILSLIPFGGIYAHYRINKLGMGFLIGFVATGIMIFPFLIGALYDIDYDGWQLIMLTLVGLSAYIGLPYYALIKWTMEYNDNVQKLNENNSQES